MLLTFGVAILFPGGVFVAASITQWYVSCINLLTAMRMKYLLHVFSSGIFILHFYNDLFVVLAQLRSVIVHFLAFVSWFHFQGKLTFETLYIRFNALQFPFREESPVRLLLVEDNTR